MLTQLSCDLPRPQVTNSEGAWWKGILNGFTGSFPYNYVQLKEVGPSPTAAPTPTSPITFSATPTATPSSVPTPSSAPSSTPSSGSKPLIARVMVAYQTTKSGQLELSPGQLVKVRNWLYSELWTLATLIKIQTFKGIVGI